MCIRDRAKWNGTSYVQINLDTGATSIEVVGDGNTVTAASYDPATRKITLTKGATHTTAAVSYTHLDVYKRQVWRYGNEI